YGTTLSLNTPQRSNDAWIRLLVAPHTASITQKRQTADNLSSRSSRRSVHFKEPAVVEVVGWMSLLA
ncbi:MAG: hypothetical protein WA375_23040, partial [Pseudolabrys sp.]